MRLGLTVANYSWPGGPEQIAPTFGRIAKDVDQAGLSSLWVMDHFFQIGQFGPPAEPMLEGYTALSYAAALTERVTLGTLVTGVTYRHPGVLLKTVTSLDVLSGGRAYLGIGAAWNDEESRGMGTPFPSPAERFEWLEETLRLAHQMFAGDDSPFEGEHFRLERPLNSPAPLRRPRILIGGTGEKKTLRFVAKYGDACNMFDDPEVLPRKIEVLKEHCEREGRAYDEIEKTVLSFMFGYAPGERSVDQAVERCHQLAELGFEHVITYLPDAHVPGAISQLAELAQRIEKFVPGSG